MENRTMPTTAGLGPMKAVGTMQRTVKNNRKGSRRPPRSLKAPRIGDTMAFRATLRATAIDTTTLPSRSPKRLALVAHRPIAVETTANEKIVFAKSYKAHAIGTIARPLGVSAARPRPVRWID